jgi:RsiW-degrading membrane proteinase PrsW (M82 family)
MTTNHVNYRPHSKSKFMEDPINRYLVWTLVLGGLLGLIMVSAIYSSVTAQDVKASGFGAQATQSAPVVSPAPAKSKK